MPRLMILLLYKTKQNQGKKNEENKRIEEVKSVVLSVLVTLFAHVLGRKKKSQWKKLSGRQESSWFCGSVGYDIGGL